MSKKVLELTVGDVIDDLIADYIEVSEDASVSSFEGAMQRSEIKNNTIDSIYTLSSWDRSIKVRDIVRGTYR